MHNTLFSVIITKFLKVLTQVHSIPEVKNDCRQYMCSELPFPLDPKIMLANFPYLYHCAIYHCMGMNNNWPEDLVEQVLDISPDILKQKSNIVLSIDPNRVLEKVQQEL